MNLNPALSLLALLIVIGLLSCKKDPNTPAADVRLTGDTTALDLGYSVASAVTLRLSANVDWRVVVPANSAVAISVAPLKGAGDAVLTITALTGNESGVSQSYTFTIQAVNNAAVSPLTITVHQGSKLAPWTQTAFGGSGDEAFNDGLLTDDGKLLLVGKTSSTDGDAAGAGFGGYDAWIVKMDLQGHILWQKKYGTVGDDNAATINRMQDGNYLVWGGDGHDQVLMKIDPLGELLWKKTVPDLGGGISVVANAKGFISVGSNPVIAAAERQIRVVQIDQDGNVLWKKEYGGNDYEGPDQIIACANGNFVFVGSTTSSDGVFSGKPAGDPDIWIVEITPDGTMVHNKWFAAPGRDEFPGIVQTSDGGYILSATTSQQRIPDPAGSHSDLWVMKLDPQLNIEWQQVLGGTQQELSKSLAAGDNDECWINYFTKSTGDGEAPPTHGGIDAVVARMKTNGEMRSLKTLGGTGMDYANKLIRIGPGRCIIAGITRSSDGDILGYHRSDDAWVMPVEE